MNKRICVFLLIMISISTPLFSASPTIIFSLGADSLLLNEEGIIFNDWFLTTDALFSYRGKIGETGYYSLFSRISGGFTYLEPYLYSDEELISLEMGFNFKNSRLLCTAGFDSSITGTYIILPFYCPEWEIAYYFITERKKVQPFLSYQGYYSIEPESEEDIFYEGIELGIKQKPSVTTGYEISLGIGWENWPEYPIYSESGSLSNVARNDFLCMANGKLGGIFRFFLDWEIALSFVLRWSNANDYIEDIDYVNEKSKDCIVIKAETAIKWSPSRYIHINLHPYFTPEIYFNKQALASDGSLKGEYVQAYTAGGNFHIDWTPDNSLYILFETEGMIYFSNNMDELSWNTLFQLGLEYSLKF